MRGRFVIGRTSDEEYMYRLIDEDGSELAHSDSFETLSACRSGITAVLGCIRSEVSVPHGEGEGFYDIFSRDGGYTFRLKGYFGEVLLIGGHYRTEAECEAAVAVMAAMELDEHVAEE